MKYKKLTLALSGAAVGIVNGLFGAGGGMIAVPLLKNNGLDTKEAHCNAVAVILPITVLSAILYLSKGYVNIGDALIYIPTGIAGSVIGTVLLKKLSSEIINLVFGGFMIYAGIRLLAR